MIFIKKYSQYFTVTSDNYSKLLHTLYDFNKSLITHKIALMKVNNSRKPQVVTKPDKHFYITETREEGYNVKQDQLRYPITLLDSLTTFLQNMGIEKDNIRVEAFKPIIGNDVNIELNPNYIPRDYQETYIQKITEFNKHNVLIDLFTGYGKMISCDTPIRLKHGWKRIGDVRRGEKVIGRDGLETTVTGVYPQGIMQLYKVTFSDGRTIEAGLDHLWTVHSYLFTKRSVKNYKYRNYIIDPFLLGLMIGSKQANVVLDIPNLSGYDINKINNGLRDIFYTEVNDGVLYIKHVNEKIQKHAIMRQLNLLKLGPDNNGFFIPGRYLSGLPKQRKDLLDGIIKGNGGPRIICDTLAYAKQIVALVESLMGIAHIDKVPGTDFIAVDIYVDTIMDIEDELPKLTNFDTIGKNMSAKVLTTEDIMNYLDTVKGKKDGSRYYIDLPEPMDKEPMYLKIHPYVMGALLGDGHMPALEITNVSDHVFNRVGKFINEGYKIRRKKDFKTFSILFQDLRNKPDIDMREALREYGLYDKRAWSKFIPEEYMEGSLEQRYELLRGLMDTDGEVGINGGASYSTTSEQLAKDVQLLVRSLGGMCSVGTRYTYYTHKGEKKRGRLSYRLHIRVKNPRDIVTLPKRRDRLKDKNQYSHNLKLRIVSIEKSVKEEAVCISVDNKDKLFVVKDYIVTHNTFISMASMSRINKTFSMIVLPRYIDKWVDDITTLTDIKRDEICIVKGLTNLVNLMHNEELAKRYKCFIISLTTLNYLVKRYLTGELTEYTDLSPDDLFDALGTEIVLNDETHQEFFNVYKTMLFSNIKLFIGITATLVTKDKELDKMYHIMFPESNRASNIVKYKPYIYITSVRFRFMQRKLIRFKNNFGYNQPMLENSIIKNRRILNNYLKMIYGLTLGFYVKKRAKDDKLMIFMGTVKMCVMMADYLRTKLKLNISKYTEEDGYDVIEKSDIIISTLQSAGTALDIPNLVTVIQTVNVDSVQANLQTLGRLRDLKGKKMDFVYIWSSDIRQHKTYNHNRMKLFRKRAKNIKSIEYREFI